MADDDLEAYDPEENEREIELGTQKLAQLKALLDQTLPCRRCGTPGRFGSEWVHDPHPDEINEQDPPYIEKCANCITDEERRDIAETHRQFAREAFAIAAEHDAPHLLDSTRESLRRLELDGQKMLDMAEEVDPSGG